MPYSRDGVCKRRVETTKPRLSACSGKDGAIYNWLIYSDAFSSRRNAVGHNINGAGTSFDARRNSKGCGNGGIAGGNAHRAEVSGAGEEEVPCRPVPNHYQRIVGGHRGVVAISGASTEAVELRTRDGVGVALGNRGRTAGDLRSPGILWPTTARSVKLDVNGAAIGRNVHYLPGRQNQETSLPGFQPAATCRAWSLGEDIGRGKFVERSGSVEDAGAGVNQDVAVGQQGPWAVSDVISIGKLRTCGPFASGGVE